jgi:hypothetical protein
MRDAPFDGEAVAYLFRHERLCEIVLDDAHGCAVDFRNIAAQCLRLARPRIGGEGRHDCGHEARSAPAQRCDR